MIDNKVANSGLITLDLSEILYSVEKKALIDIKDFLFKGLLLKEKEYRASLKSFDWEPYRDKFVGIYCSTDAIVPHWAYMLLITYLNDITPHIILGGEKAVDSAMSEDAIGKLDVAGLENERIVIKGCNEDNVPQAAYAILTKHLYPVAKSIMYGEPCSTVPIYKKK